MLRGASDRLLYRAGLSPEQTAQKFEDAFYQMCLQASGSNNDIYGMDALNSWRMTWMLWSSGSEILSPISQRSLGMACGV